MKTKSTGIAIFKKEIAPIVQIALKLKVSSPQEMERASEMLSRLNKINDRITEEKEKVTLPLNQALKAERARWKPIESMYEDAITDLREKMSDYQTEQVRLQKEEENRIAARVGDGKGKFKIETAVRKIGEVEAPETKITTDNGQVKFRTVQKLKILDINKIPDRYWVVYEEGVLDALKAGIVVDGAEIEERQVPVNSR